jgi:hypothetical protein
LVQEDQPMSTKPVVQPSHNDCKQKYSQCAPLQFCDHWLGTLMLLPVRCVKWHKINSGAFPSSCSLSKP